MGLVITSTNKSGNRVKYENFVKGKNGSKNG